MLIRLLESWFAHKWGCVCKKVRQWIRFRTKGFGRGQGWREKQTFSQKSKCYHCNLSKRRLTCPNSFLIKKKRLEEFFSYLKCTDAERYLLSPHLKKFIVIRTLNTRSTILTHFKQYFYM